MSTCLLAAAVAMILAGVAPAATLRGKIVEDHSGTPVASASVRVIKAGERRLAADLETDKEGRYEASELAGGEYRIEVSKPNYLNVTLRLTLTAGGSTANLPSSRAPLSQGR